MTPNEWILGGDTGVSSKTIWAVMMGCANPDMDCFFNIPLDPSDFGRCYRLLNQFPEWKTRLDEVGECFPKWKPLLREWDNLTSLYEKVKRTGKGRSKLYLKLLSLHDECVLYVGVPNEK